MKKQQEKINFIEVTLYYYRFLQNRFNNVCEYIYKIDETCTVKEVE